MRIRGSGLRWSSRKIVIAVLASIGILAMVGTTLASMLPILVGDHAQNSARPSAASRPAAIPSAAIKPLSVRTVVDAPLVATSRDCPPVPPPTPQQEPVRVCDVDKAAVYQLGPVALQVNLTGVNSARLPTTGFYTVQMGMDEVSRAAFAQYTAANLGKRVAFVRDGVVLAAPTILERIDGQWLQITGKLTAATAETTVRMLRDGS